MEQTPSPELLIEELLNQNTQLRLELAMLTALQKSSVQVEQPTSSSSGIPPEALEILSKLDIK